MNKRTWMRALGVGMSVALVAVLVMYAGVYAYVYYMRYHPTRAQVTGVSDQLLHDVVQFQDKDGLYHLPEAPQDTSFNTRIHATFYAANILRDRISDTRRSELIDSLKKALVLDELFVEQKLEAYGLLLKLGDKNSEKDAQKYYEEQKITIPQVVTRENVTEYMNFIEISSYLYSELDVRDDNENKPTLQLWDLEENSDESDERIAASVLAMRWAFKNENEIEKAFPTLRKKMKSWLRSKDAMLMQQLISAEAAGVLEIDDKEYNNELMPQIWERQGCKDSSILFSIDGNSQHACSFAMSSISSYSLEDKG
ncbi:MAG: hypothetical protein J6M18_04620 [Actinomycetaceae bacterium]|nr:hypothetical protein [Actinomycetaceae bacterium]